MSHQLLCDWLDLPRHPWPPNYYALLGLALGEGTADEIERRVLERMEKLRRYKLRHPEPVTEGMNLLAQAMIHLSDPSARRDYDGSLGLAVSQIEEPPVEARDESVIVEPIPLPAREFVEEQPRAEVLVIPELPEEILPLDEVEEEPVYGIEPLPLEERPAAEPVRPAPRKVEPRRALYAELARLRRVLRIWERLRTFLDDASVTFSRRARLQDLMAGLSELRPILPTVTDLIGGPDQPGHLVAAFARQEIVVETLRSLLPSQRDAMAKDCRSAHYLLLERYRDLRQEVRRQTEKSFARRVWLPLWREVYARPEWLCLLVGIVALVIAFVRSMPK